MAIISLVVALSGLAYNIWRNEASEANSTTRYAGFFMMRELSQLQEVVLSARFDQSDKRGNIKVGWSHVLAGKDVSYVMPTSVQDQVENLHQIWRQHSGNLRSQPGDGYRLMDSAIDMV